MAKQFRFLAKQSTFNMNKFNGNFNLGESAFRNFIENGRSDLTYTSRQYSRSCTNDVCEECVNGACEKCVKGKCRYNGNSETTNTDFNARPSKWNVQSRLWPWNRESIFWDSNENDKWESTSTFPSSDNSRTCNGGGCLVCTKGERRASGESLANPFR